MSDLIDELLDNSTFKSPDQEATAYILSPYLFMRIILTR